MTPQIGSARYSVSMGPALGTVVTESTIWHLRAAHWQPQKNAMLDRTWKLDEVGTVTAATTPQWLDHSVNAIVTQHGNCALCNETLQGRVWIHRLTDHAFPKHNIPLAAVCETCRVEGKSCTLTDLHDAVQRETLLEACITALQANRAAWKGIPHPKRKKDVAALKSHTEGCLQRSELTTLLYTLGSDNIYHFWRQYRQYLGSLGRTKLDRVISLTSRYGSSCVWCSRQLHFNRSLNEQYSATIEHLQPQREEVNNSLENLRLACKQCNGKRGHTPLPEWIAICQQKGMQVRYDTLSEVLV